VIETLTPAYRKAGPPGDGYGRTGARQPGRPRRLWRRGEADRPPNPPPTPSKSRLRAAAATSIAGRW